MKVYLLNDYSFRSNSYLLEDELTGEAAIIDPSMPCQMYSDIIEKSQLELKYILITHNHFDHIFGYDELFKKYGIIGIMNDLEMKYMNDVDKNASCLIGSDFHVNSPVKACDPKSFDCNIGKSRIDCIETPGHSIGSLTFACDGKLFSGDLLFYGSIGRTDLFGGDICKLLNSVELLFRLFPDNSVVYPGHGPNTTLKYEMNNNPFI